VEEYDRCHLHGSVAAVAKCCLCAHLICDRCNVPERHTQVGFIRMDYYFCRHCIAQMQKLEQEFLSQLASSGRCAKHRDQRKDFTCKHCKLPLCGSCSYYATESSFFAGKRITDGPYCLLCFRTQGHTGSKAWISGRDAISRKLQ
jgi:hypothetical protein